MYLGTNLQYLRKCNGSMTQEKLSQLMGVSRQTVSKWESGEASPELGNLLELCAIFGCTLDDLLRKDMTIRPLSHIRIVNLPAFWMAQYVIISANAEKDVLDYTDRWAMANGFYEKAPRIHWPFPYVSAEQKNRFGLRGHGAAYILPDAVSSAEDIQLIRQMEASYAMIRVEADSSANQLYPQIVEFLSNNGIKKVLREGALPCFEREYQENGIRYKEVFVQCEQIPDAEDYTIYQKGI